MKISVMAEAGNTTKEIWSESKNPKHSDSKFSKPPRHHTSGELSSKRLVHVYGEESDWCEEMLGLENGTSLILSLLNCKICTNLIYEYRNSNKIVKQITEITKLRGEQFEWS